VIRTCPDCHGDLSGISISRRRQRIELPPPPPVEVTEYRVYKGWCQSCQKWHEAPFELPEGLVMGQGRLGVRITSMIAYLRTVMRLPIRQVQSYLQAIHGFAVSVGEIVEIQHRMRKQTAGAVQALKEEIRASKASQADETSWRENGKNGYVWSVNTPTIRYYEYHQSRSGKIVKELVGDNYEGVLGSDFYAGYNAHLGLHQRCWVHFLRDVHELKKRHPSNEDLLAWSKDVKSIYDRAVAYAGLDPGEPPTKQETARQAQQHAFEQELWAVCAPYAHTSAPQHTLCERVERFLPELFVFVAIPGVPAHNNLAERSVRPLVIARKISGGTRSPQGSQTRMALFSLFSTWIAQGLDPFSQCLSLLSRPSL
jgi:transposase